MNDKQIFANRWVSVYEDENGYTYSHETRCGGHIVSVLVYKIDGNSLKFFGRVERCPAHNKNPVLELASITGGVDDMDPVKTALNELREEAGLVATADDLTDLGIVYPSKSADTVVHLYAVCADGLEQVEAEGDGSRGEIGAYCRWIDMDAAIQCTDPLMHAAIARLANGFEFDLVRK